MASRMKEDEKNEKIIRGLLKLPENRRCINCNSLGPQYVCTNFWTFVCTNCSGIHREFTHRVKSVSMAKFTSQEVSALQGGGNGRARETYFKEWDPQRHSIPDSSNIMKLRDFIKHVYVDRRYTGERGVDKPPRVKMGDKEDSYENRRVDTHRGGSRSPSYDDQGHSERSGLGGRSPPYDDQRKNERSSLGGRSPPYEDQRSGYGARNDDKIYRYNYDEKRSPGYERETRPGEFRKSPVRFEVVDDRRRDDRYGNGRRFEERRLSDGESKFGGFSPNRQKDPEMSVPPIVRPVREILGEDVPPLRVGEPPKANGGKATLGSTHTQRTASSSSLGSIDGSSVELKRVNSGSLIDFNADPEPPVATTGLPAQPTTIPAVQSDTQPTGPSVDAQNWANFDFSPQTLAPAPAPAPAPSKVNSLESLLSELSALAPAPAPAQAPAPTPLPVGNTPLMPTTSGAPTVEPAGQWPSVQQHPSSLFAATDGYQSSALQFVPSNQTSNNQNKQGPFSPVGQPSQATSFSVREASSRVTSQPTPSEAKISGRKELPEDLFALTYSSAPAPVRGWHPGPSPSLGFGMQYPTAVPMTAFPHSSKSANPFDLNNEPTIVHTPSLPSLSSLQGALPAVAAAPNLLRSSSLGTAPPQWIPPQSPSYASSVQSPSYASSVQSPSYASAFTPGPYMGQQVSSNMSTSGHQASVGAFGGDASFFGNLTTDQQYGRFSQPTTPNSFSSAGGNPFG